MILCQTRKCPHGKGNSWARQLIELEKVFAEDIPEKKLKYFIRKSTNSTAMEWML